MYMTMTNLKQLEHNSLSMSIEEAGRRKRKGYQYIPDIPIEEPPLPLKRERKKVQYNDYINPVKALRKSPTRKRSPVRKFKKARPTVKKQKLSDTEEFLQSLNDKKKELEEKLLQINADLADVTSKLTSKDDSDEEEPEAEKDVEMEDNEDEEDENESIDLKEEKLEKEEVKENTEDKEDEGDTDSEGNNNLESKENDKEENVEKKTPTKTPKKPPKKPKRRRAVKKKKDTKGKSPDSKRPARVTRTSEALSAAELQAANQIAFTKIINNLMKHRYAKPFLLPVDPIALNIPDYPTIIKNPMDFGTIKSKLEDKSYSSPKEFAEDVTLVFSNACTYNQPGSDVFIMATTIQEVFIKKMNPTLSKQGFTPLAAPQNLPNIPLRSSILYQPIAPTPAYSELKKSVDSLKKELQNLKSLGNKAAKPSPKIVEKEQIIPMTRDEKRKLSNDINKLSSEHLGTVVKIIKQKMPIGDVDEIVIDIDSLDSATLRDLEQYVLKVQKKTSRRGRPNNRNQSNESKMDLKKAEETIQQIEPTNNVIDNLANSDRNLANSTTISFSNPEGIPDNKSEVAEDSQNNNHQSDSDSDSASDTDSDASSSESGSDVESASESESENMDSQNN